MTITKPCPFCSSEKVIIDNLAADFKIVICTDCEASMPAKNFDDALLKWNTRYEYTENREN